MTAFVERVGDGGRPGPIGAVDAAAPVLGPDRRRHDRRVRDAGSAHATLRAGVPGDRRTQTTGRGLSIIACVDVQPAACDQLTPERTELIWRVALLRMERCIRPGDRLCLLGGARVAVCLGAGADRVAPGALGRRLARALEDRLALGDTGLGLDVAIGIGVDASGGTEPTALAEAALSSLRHRLRAPGRHGTAPYVTVTWVPGPATLLVSSDTTAGFGAHETTHPARRLRHRALVPVRDEFVGPAHTPGTANGNGVEPAEAWDAVAASLRVLLVDPEGDLDHGRGTAIDVVAEIIRRAGARSAVCSAADDQGVLLEVELRRPDVVVLALGTEGARHDADLDPNLAWDRPARITRVVRDTGTPVIAVSMGASAAALAVCVEQGSIGLFHPELLAQELARQTNRRFANGNGNGAALNGHDEPRGPGQLPPPYHALVRLTPSERRVLFHMMEGRAAAEIATTLVVSLTTVRSHIRSILRKLNVNSQLAAVALAFGTMPDGGGGD